MTDSQEIQATLRHYVKTRMTDTAAPSELDRAFYPKLKDIKNHIYLAKIKLRITKLDQDNFRQKLEDWKTDGACSFFRPYRNNNPTTISAADQSVQEGLIACVEMETAEPDPTQHESDVTEQPPSFPAPEESDEVVDSDVYEETLLFVHQEKWQQDVLKQHGNTICLIDATHKTTKYDLALFFISVQTNCGYIVVAVFIVQSEKACHIKEALKVLKEWNPGWDPKFWMCDFSDAECNALQSAFPNTQVYLCDFHREQAWTRWVRNSKHGLSREEGEQLLHLLRGITAAPPGDTEVDEHYQRHVGILKASSLWKKPQVRVWLESKWLSIPERWARAFRNSTYHAAVGTTNLVESQKKVLKYSYLKKAKGDKTISSILDVIINHYLPAHHQEYVFAQYNTSEEHRLYNEKGPKVSNENSPAEEAQEPDDRGEIYAEAIPRRRTNTHPEPAANESRKRAREALETLQAMICSCANGPALDTLTAGIEALTQSFKEFLDECPEGLPLLPHTCPHSHSGKQKGMETDPTPLPLAKSATRDRSDYTYRGGCGVKADAAREKPKTVKPAQGSSDGPEAKKAKIDPNETTMVKKTASFCSLKEALEVDWTSEKAKASLKRTPVDYFLLHVLLKFRTDKGRDPDPQSFAEDSQLLRQIRDDVLESLAVSGDLLSDDFVSYCFSEMSPVCAVVGGVLGQEVVKALSQRDAPHRNFFFFDGRKGNGVVDYFGPN
ncbi:SUMO-activating enzyme subunit 1 isoform X1 [Myripristis murdjan]|nr:SUMO-activating enzyme subunit 1 isoform X1 [Myripristis murdjan]